MMPGSIFLAGNISALQLQLLAHIHCTYSDSTSKAENSNKASEQIVML